LLLLLPLVPGLLLLVLLLPSAAAAASEVDDGALTLDDEDDEDEVLGRRCMSSRSCASALILLVGFFKPLLVPGRLFAVAVPGLLTRGAEGAAAGVMGRSDAAAFIGLLVIAPRCTPSAPLSHLGDDSTLLVFRPLRLLMLSYFRSAGFLEMEAAAAEAGRDLKSSSAVATDEGGGGAR